MGVISHIQIEHKLIIQHILLFAILFPLVFPLLLFPAMRHRAAAAAAICGRGLELIVLRGVAVAAAGARRVDTRAICELRAELVVLRSVAVAVAARGSLAFLLGSLTLGAGGVMQDCGIGPGGEGRCFRHKWSYYRARCPLKY